MSNQPGRTGAKLSAFFHLPGPERARLSQALMLIPLVSFGLKLFGFRRIYRLLDLWAPNPEGAPPAELEQADRIADLVGKAAWQGFYPVTCLPRSLSLLAILRRNKIPARLCIGIRRSDDGIQGHAWVEVGQVSLLESEETIQQFSQIPLTNLNTGIKLD